MSDFVPREGMATVWDAEGNYLGVIDVETWLAAQGSAAVAELWRSLDALRLELPERVIDHHAAIVRKAFDAVRCGR